MSREAHDQYGSEDRTLRMTVEASSLRAVHPRLLYIAGWGRNGSTILGNMLGTIPGVFDAGELRHFWGRIDREDHVCGCGVAVNRCEFWQDVRSGLLADEDMPTAELNSVRGWQREATRQRMIPRIARATELSDLPRSPFADFVLALRCLYRSIARVSGADVIVDSSKQTGYGALACFATDRPWVFVQLVRDPRAVAFSWQRITAASPTGSRTMPRHGAAASSTNWVMYNLGGALLRSRAGESGVLVRYEDLVRAPRRSVSRVTGRLQGKETGVPFADEHTVDLPPNHAFAGNPSRFRHGLVALSDDDEWTLKQRRIDRLVCELITLPMLPLYGYGLRVRAQRT